MRSIRFHFDGMVRRDFDGWPRVVWLPDLVIPAQSPS